MTEPLFRTWEQALDWHKARVAQLEAALHALVAQEPVWESDWGTLFCAYCEGCDITRDERKADTGAFKVVHAPACLWVAARNILKGNGDG